MIEAGYKKAEQVDKMLRDHDISAECYPYSASIPVISVEILWGDWKHDHLRAKLLIQQLGLEFVNTLITEEDGSDCYSAIHHFKYF